MIPVSPGSELGIPFSKSISFLRSISGGEKNSSSLTVNCGTLQSSPVDSDGVGQHIKYWFTINWWKNSFKPEIPSVYFAMAPKDKW